MARHPIISLSVDNDNDRAKVLYERLGFQSVGVEGTATTMLRRPSDPASSRKAHSRINALPLASGHDLPGSFNGRTSVFGAVYRGSNPLPGTQFASVTNEQGYTNFAPRRR